MKTVMEKKHEQKIEWFLIDATDLVLGRLSTSIAALLRGKHKPLFTPHLTGSTGIIVINADKIKVTGNKETKKKYFHHTGYSGGGKLISYNDHVAIDPTFPLRHSVNKMLPKNRLRSVMLSRLKIYTGENHPHQAQQVTIHKIGK